MYHKDCKNGTIIINLINHIAIAGVISLVNSKSITIEKFFIQEKEKVIKLEDIQLFCTECRKKIEDCDEEIITHCSFCGGRFKLSEVFANTANAGFYCVKCITTNDMNRRNLAPISIENLIF